MQQVPGRAVGIRYVDAAGAAHTTTARLASGSPQ
jgi:hypothetical protein